MFKIRNTSEITRLSANPRKITPEQSEALQKSISDNPEYFNARPIILSDRTGKPVAIAGNQRLQAAIALGMGQVPTFLIGGLTEAKEREITVRDNVSNGEWDWDVLAGDWATCPLDDWGLDVPEIRDFDYTDKNKEIDVDAMADEMVIRLNYTESEYNIVKGQLQKIASTPEQAVWKLLGNE